MPSLMARYVTSVTRYVAFGNVKILQWLCLLVGCTKIHSTKRN